MSVLPVWLLKSLETPVLKDGCLKREGRKIVDQPGARNWVAAILLVRSFCLFSIIPVSSALTLDPKTQAWIKNSIDPTFGFPSLVRFSWTTVKVALEKDAHDVKW